MYTIKRLSKLNKYDVLIHLKKLNKEDRYLRFCTHANDDYIENYVNKMNFINNGIYGVYNNECNLIGIGECVLYNHKEGEVAFSVDANEQGHGIGTKLMIRLIQYANSIGVKKLNMISSKSNVKSIKLAKRFGVTHNSIDDIETDITMPNTPNYIQMSYEILENWVANWELTQKKMLNIVYLK